MSSRLLLLVALLVTLTAPALAKPPDLPVDTSIDCTPQVPAPEAYAVPPNDPRSSVFQYPKELLIQQRTQQLVSVLDEVDDNPVKDILVNVEETRSGSLMFSVGVQQDCGRTGLLALTPACMCCCAGETPIDGLWFGLIERDEEPTPYTELLLNTLFPPLRLRHLSPSNVKVFVEDMKPQVKALNEKCRDMVGQWFTKKTDEAFEDQIDLLPPGPQITTRLDSERCLFERMRQKALEHAQESDESREPPTCTHSPDEVMNLPSAHGPQHNPKNIPPTPEFPLSRELATMEAQEAAGDAETQEPPTAEKDCYEVQIQIKNLRTGEVVVMPKMFLEDGQNGTRFLQEYGAAVHAQVKVDSLKPAVKMPPEPEQLEVMPHVQSGIEPQEEEDAPPQAQQRYSVGQILIVGNSCTPEKVILAEIPFQSGMEIGPSHLQMAEKNLAATGLFTIDAQRGIRPTIEVLYADADMRVKDVLVTVEEKAVQCPAAEEEEAPPAQERDADEDCWEVTMVIRNVRTREIISTPRMVIDDGQDCKVSLERKNVAVQFRVKVDSLKPAVKMPPEPKSSEPEEEEAAPPQAHKPMRVGQVVIVGNTCTPDHVILSQLPFAAGMELSYPDLRTAEKNLAAVFGFLPAPHKYPVARPKVQVLDPESDSEFKDVLITVEETSASRCTDWEECEPASDEEPIPVPAPTCPAIKAAPAISPEPECTCPYLKKQQQKQTEPVDPDAVFKDDVMDNLDKLTRARKAFEKAEKFRDDGDMDSAAYWYTKVKEICPGSRFDKMATERMEEIATDESDENPDPVTPIEQEEESTTGSEDGCVHLLDSLFHHRTCAVPERCCARMTLLFSFCCGFCDCQHCSLIWKVHACMPLPADEPATTYPGCHTDTEDEDVQPPDQPKPISDKDIHAALFIGRMFGPLKDEAAARYVAGLFGPIPRKSYGPMHRAWLDPIARLWQEVMPFKAVEPTGATEEAEPKDEEDEGPSGDCCQPYDVRIQPPLPPIDPRIVETMEKVLKETGDPKRAKLIVLPEPPQSDPAEQEEPVSQWPLVPPEVEMPSLFVDPDADLDLDDADATAEPQPAAQDDTGAVFQQALDALKKGLYVDIDGFDENSGQASLTLAVGGMEFRVMLDGEGHRYFLVGLLPEATRDVKLIQQSLNERVMRWIESMNGGGNKVEEPAEDGSDEDRDDGGGDEEDDMGA